MTYDIKNTDERGQRRARTEMKKKVYISGPITGIPYDKCRKAFSEVQQRLEAMGYETVNPLENGLPAEAAYEEHMKADIAMLLRCDCIYAMKGWTGSNGCMTELAVCKATGIQLLEDEEKILTSPN